jgi:hypothetical protein
MGNFNASDITSREAVKVTHVGLVSKTIDYTLSETASGSTTINMMRMPGGARIQELILNANCDGIGTGAETVAVYDSLGNTYIKTTTFAASLRMNDPSGQNARLTGSANLILQLCNCVGTGTATMQFAMTTMYLGEDDAD